MPHPLETGTIRILRPDGSTAGTGFLVSKRLAVTCAHVITSAKAKPGDVIKFKFHLGDLEAQQAKVLENGWSTENDVAILELTEKLPKWIHPIIMQSSRAMEGRAFQGLGYPNDGPVQTRWPQGNISGRVEVQGYINPLLQIQGKEIDKGLSGSAVVDHTTRRVIGMITAYQDVTRPSTAENLRFGYAVPTETIWKIYPDLEKELPPLPKRSPLVEGIHLLPNGYDFRIQNFLSEYLGSPEQPEPFGGREDALKALDDWLDGDTQRLVLAAPAGRGKSALLVRWLDRLIAREDLALVFVPVSVRFRTNLASTFFGSLAARLAYLHGEDVPTSEMTSTDVWRGLVNAYLTKPLTDDRKLLVVLDGLDEAGDWEATADLIPAELSRNVRLVVSARYLAGDSDVLPWLARLGWEHTAKASTLDLDPLDSNGVADVLFRMGVPLDVLSHRVDIVYELQRLSEGDPLLVNLYVEDLWSRGEQASSLQPEDLQTIKPGYEGYFDRWWTEQKKLWGKEAPLREKNIRLIFNLLCSAMGSLTKDDLLALDSENELNTFIIEEALDALKRFVIGIPDDRKEKEIRYVHTHPRLRDYFWDKLTIREQKELENRFLSWGKHIMQALKHGQLSPSNTPHYLIQYYGAHLERSVGVPERYYEFISKTWMQAWYAFDGTYSGFLNDVERAWQVADQIFVLSTRKQVQEDSQRLVATIQQIRAALYKSSISSLSNNILPGLLAQALESRILIPRQILVMISLITSNDSKRADCILEVSKFFPLAIMPDLIAIAQSIPDPYSRVRALSGIAPYLASTFRDDFMRNLLTFACSIVNERTKARIFFELVPHLPENMKMEIASLTLTISHQESYRTYTLGLLESYLSNEIKRNELKVFLLKDNLFLFDDEFALKAIGDLASNLPQDIKVEIIDLAKTIKEELDRAKVLNALVPYLSTEIMEKYLEVADSISDPTAKMLSLSKIEIKLQEESISEEALQNILSNAVFLKLADLIIILYQKLSDAKKELFISSTIKTQTADQRGSIAIGAVFSLLNDELKSEVLVSIKKLWTDSNRADVLVKIARHLTSKRLQLEAFSIARALEWHEYKTRALVGLAPYLFEDLKRQVVQEALMTSTYIDDEWARSDSLFALAPYLPLDLHENLLSVIANSTKSENWQVDALIQLIPHLSMAMRDGAISRCIDLIRSFTPPRAQDIDDPEGINAVNQAAALSKLAPYLPNSMMQKAITASLQIERGGALANALIGLSPYLPRQLKQDVFMEVMQFPNTFNKAVVLVNLMKDQTKELEAKALEVVIQVLQRPLRGPDLMSTGTRILQLSYLMPYLPADIKNSLAIEAIDAIKSIEENYDNVRAQLLSALIPSLSSEMKYEVFLVAKAIKSEWGRGEVYRGIFPHLPKNLKNDILKLVLEFNKMENKARVLARLGENLPENYVGEALQAVQLVGDEQLQVNLLDALLQYLSPEKIDQALTITMAISKREYRLLGLKKIAPYLAGPVLEGALQSIIQGLFEYNEHYLRTELARGISLSLTALAEYDLTSGCGAWIKLLHTIARNNRREMLVELNEVFPFIFSLNSNELSHSLSRGVFYAIQEVAEY